ncbi:trypsin-1-like [Anticarsia gemmatalis]|uniref:trypsin-1-like n=1 Tax=Anticarsia gemmatalis TaxID=129554 RepID=UPI003F77738D
MGSTINLYFLTILIGAVASFDVSRLNVEKVHDPIPYEDTIIGGEEVSIEQYPYMALYGYVVPPFTEFCGAFIISENYALTAAHCTFLADKMKVELRVGNSYGINGTSVFVSEVINHPNYDPKTVNNDVAILKTVEPIKFSDTVKPVELPPRGVDLEVGSMVDVSGWGSVEWGRSGSAVLRAVKVPVTNREECKKLGKPYDTVNENMFCAGYEEGGKDSCKGDSGGPVVQNGKVVGIVSFGRGCALPKSPGVYAFISAPSIRDFIKKHTGL